MLGVRALIALTLVRRVEEDDTVSVGDIAAAEALCELVGVVGGVGSCEKVELDVGVRGTIATGEAGECSGDTGGGEDTVGRGGRVVGGVGSCERNEPDVGICGTIATEEAGERSGSARVVEDTVGRGGRVVDLRGVEGEGESSITGAEDGNEGLHACTFSDKPVATLGTGSGRLREAVTGLVAVIELQ